MCMPARVEKGMKIYITASLKKIPEGNFIVAGLDYKNSLNMNKIKKLIKIML